MKHLIKWFLDPPTDAPTATVLLRLIVGGVFFSEGILKFVFAVQGVGRFTKLGLPEPEMTANFVGPFEIVGGILLVAGLLTAVPVNLKPGPTKCTAPSMATKMLGRALNLTMK